MIKKVPTIKEVAKLAGVSIATVSRYLTNPKKIKLKNQKKIAFAIQKLNYKPFVYAQKLAGKKLNCIGLIIPGYEGIFYSFYALEIIRQVAKNLDEFGFDLHLHIYWNRDKFKSSFVDGVIFADIIGNLDQLKRLIKEEIPLVVINHKFEEELDVNYIAINNFKGSYEATELMINYGHRKIAYFAGDLKVQCAKERLDGFYKALEKYNILVHKEFIRFTDFSPQKARKEVEELFKLKELPTAIICCSDEVAYEVFNFLREKGMDVPKDISIVGFDDNPFYYTRDLQITTVRQPFEKMAKLAVEILKKNLEKIDNPKQKIVLDPEIVIKESVAQAKN